MRLALWLRRLDRHDFDGGDLYCRFDIRRRCGLAQWERQNPGRHGSFGRLNNLRRWSSLLGWGRLDRADHLALHWLGNVESYFRLREPSSVARNKLDVQVGSAMLRRW